MPYKKWLSESGIPWPYKDEFEIGCTVEHAGYPLTWLVAFFGPARLVSAFSTIILPDKGCDEPLEREAPDYSVTNIVFDSGVVVRLTCGIMAPRDHSLNFFGDDGVMRLEDVSHDHSPVRIQRFVKIRRRLMLTPWKRRYPAVGKDQPQRQVPGLAEARFRPGNRRSGGGHRREAVSPAGQ